MAHGTSGPHGLPAPPLAQTERCTELVSVTAPRTEARSAEENGKKPPTASSETAQVLYSSFAHANINGSSVERYSSVLSPSSGREMAVVELMGQLQQVLWWRPSAQTESV